MDKIKYLNDILKLKGYIDMESYIDRRSNEILFDEVWLWRTKMGIQEDFPALDSNEIIRILKDVMYEIIKKGGVVVDYSHGEVEEIIMKFNDKKNHELIDEIANFMINNPEYGSDGNGVWFE